MKIKENVLYVLHYQGQIISPNIWKQFSKNYGSSSLSGWKPPKKIYFSLSYAKSAIKHLPQQIRDKIEIVRYVPEDSKE